MSGWIREHVAPVASWTAAWTAVGALIGGAAYAVASMAGLSTLGLTGLRIVLLSGLALGVCGIICALVYHGLALRGRPPRHISALATLMYGALAGLLPILTWTLEAKRRGSQSAFTFSAAVVMTGMSAATALYLRWRDQRRYRVQQQHQQQQLADLTSPGVEQSLRRDSADRVVP